MNISKLNLKDFNTGQMVEATFKPKEQVIKSFSFFGQKEVVEEKEYTKNQFEAEIKKEFQKGYDEGLKISKQEMDSYVSTEDIKIKEQVSSLLSRFSENLNSFATQYENLKLEMAKLAAYATKKICAQKLNENADQIILDAVAKSSEILKKEPSVLIKCNNILMQKIKPVIEDYFSKNLQATKITFEETEDIKSAPQISIEWDKSGISINLQERLDAVDEIFNEFIKTL